MASNKKKNATVKKTSWLRIVGVLGVIALLCAVPFITARDAINSALIYTFGDSNSYEIHGASPTLSGYRAGDVKMNLANGSVLIRQISVETGFLGMLKNAYSLSTDRPVDNLTLIFEDIRNPDGYALFDEIGAFAANSASIFEAQGCGSNKYWTENELSSAMSLSTTPGRMKVEFSQEGDLVVKTSSFSAPGAGSATLRETAVAIPTRESLFAIPRSGALTKLGMTISDDGFIKARNNYCAQATKVSVEQFIENHMASVKRILLAGGAKASDELLAVYRNFATNGGELEIDVDRSNAAPGKTPSLGDLLVSFKGEVRLGDEKALYAFETIPAMDWPKGAGDKTAYQVLVAEDGLPVAGAASDASTNADGSEIGTVVVRGKTELLLSPEIISINRVDPEYLTSIGAILPFKGRRLRFERNGKASIDGRLLGPTKDGIRIRVSQPGGYAEIELPAKDFKRAILFPNRG